MMDKIYKYLSNFYPHRMINSLLITIFWTIIFTISISVYLSYDLNISTIKNKIEYIEYSYIIFLLFTILFFVGVYSSIQRFGLDRYNRDTAKNILFYLIISTVIYFPFMVIKTIILEKFNVYYVSPTLTPPTTI